MSRWTVLFSSVMPASGTRQIDKTFIKGLLTIQDEEFFKSHKKRKLRQQYRKITLLWRWNGSFGCQFSPHLSRHIGYFREIPKSARIGNSFLYSTPRLSFWTVWFRHNPDWSLWLPWATILKTLKRRSAFKENAKAKHFQGKKRKRFSSFLQNLSGASSLCVSDEVFWTEDLIVETTKRLHDLYNDNFRKDLPILILTGGHKN